MFGEPSTWQEQIERIVIDKRSGSSEISRRCAKALITYADQERASGVEQVVYAVSEAAAKVVRAHPSMASVVRILNDAVLATVSAETVRSALDQVRRVGNEYLAWAEQASLLVVESALELLPREGVILVLSYSGAVAKSLIDAAHRGYRLGVICLESRPMYEGRRLATVLSQSGLDVSLIVDAAALDGLHEADMFVVGVECLTETGLISKVGTTMIACAAQSVGVPAYAIGDTSKVWPSQLGGALMLDHGAGEVWPNAPRPIRIRNRYLDLTPWDRVGGVVTERGTIGRYEVSQIGATIDVAPRVADIVSSIRGK